MSVRHHAVISIDFGDDADEDKYTLHDGAERQDDTDGRRALRIAREGPHAKIPVNISPDVMPDCTLAIWVKLETIANDRGWLLGNEVTNFDRTIVLHDDRFDGVGSTIGMTWNASLGPPPIGQWMFVVARFKQGGVSHVFLDGRKSWPSPRTENRPSGGQRELWLGRPCHGGHWVDCWVKRVEVYASALQDDDIALLRAQGMDPSPNAGALTDITEAEGDLTEEAEVVHFYVDNTEKLSGFGRVGDNYYHFLIDFCARVISAVGRQRCIVHVRPTHRERDRYHLPDGETRIFAQGARSIFEPLDCEPFNFWRKFHDMTQGRIELVYDGQHSGERIAFVPERDMISWGPAPHVYPVFRSTVLARYGLEHVQPDCILVLIRSARSTARLGPRAPCEGFLEAVRSSVGDRQVIDVEFTTESVPTQAHYFARASCVVANHGAGLANLVFCRRGTHVVEVEPVPPDIPCYEHLCAGAGLAYHRVRNDAPSIRAAMRDNVVPLLDI